MIHAQGGSVMRSVLVLNHFAVPGDARRKPARRDVQPIDGVAIS